MVIDIFGREVKEGDFVAYAQQGGHGTLMVGRVRRLGSDGTTLVLRGVRHGRLCSRDGETSNPVLVLTGDIPESIETLLAGVGIAPVTA